MSRNSTGTYSRPTPPGAGGYVPGTSIKSSEINGEFNDIKTEITDSLSRSGKGSPLTNIDFGGFKITNAAQSNASGQFVEYAQWQADTAAANLLTKIKTVDGAGSGLDADLLDGQTSAYFAPIASASFVGQTLFNYSATYTFNAASVGSFPALAIGGSYGGGIVMNDSGSNVHVGMYADTTGLRLNFFTGMTGSDTAISKVKMTLDSTGLLTVAGNISTPGNASINTLTAITANISGSATVTSTVSANYFLGQNIAKTYLHYNGTTATILNSFNIASISKLSTGVYRVNMTGAMPNANYAVIASYNGDITPFVSYIGSHNITNRTVSSFDISLFDSNSAVDTTDLNILIFGN